jgi:signal transduction histidine kinase
LGSELISRFSKLTLATVAGYALLVILVFAVLGEIQLRRSLERSTDVVESLLGLYADPEGSPTTVAPNMLADQLVGMDQTFAITRTTGSGDSSAVYFLTPDMPAKRLEGLGEAVSPEEVRTTLLMAIAERARWRYRVLHRNAGDFDVYVAASRAPLVRALAGIAVVALGILPLAVFLARRAVRRSVADTLVPLGRAVESLGTIGPDDLDRRLETPTGQAEITALAEGANRMLERVERAHQALKAFTADASHELRTPLSRIRAQAQWAQDGDRSGEQMREALAAIERDVDGTTKMVEDLLLIARGENRQLEVNRQAFDLTEVAGEVYEIGQAMVEHRPVVIQAAIGTEAIMAIGDAERTRHILLNLVSNAVRYTAKGCVSIAVRRDSGDVAVDVSDTGPGIPSEELGKVFDRFYRVDVSRSRALGGAGLGLTIARLLAELQDGRIDVQSVPGEGSTFTLWLPAAG